MGMQPVRSLTSTAAEAVVSMWRCLLGLTRSGWSRRPAARKVPCSEAHPGWSNWAGVRLAPPASASTSASPATTCTAPPPLRPRRRRRAPPASASPIRIHGRGENILGLPSGSTPPGTRPTRWCRHWGRLWWGDLDGRLKFKCKGGVVISDRVYPYMRFRFVITSISSGSS